MIGAVQATPPAFWLTPAEAASRLGVEKNVLRRWRQTGSGPDFWRTGRKKARRVMYKQADVDAWLNAQIVPARVKGASA